MKVLLPVVAATLQLLLIKSIDGEECPNYIVSIEKNRNDGNGPKRLCGGAIIDKFYVLTAAHCVYGYKSSQLSVRTHGMKNKFCNRPDTYVDVTATILHPSYRNVIDDSYLNDIAVLKISGFTLDGKNIAKIKLPTLDFTPTNSRVFVSRLFKNDDSYEMLENIVMSPGDCQRKMNYKVIGHSHICTLVKNYSHESKSNDGGPLLDEYDNIVGIYIDLKNNSTEVPELFTRVSFFFNFIRNVLKGRYERKVSEIQRENPDQPKYIVWIKLRQYDGVTFEHVCSAVIIHRYFIITAAKFVFGLNTKQLLVRTNPWVVSSSRPFYDQVAIMKFHHPIAVLKVTFGFDDFQNELVQLPDYHTNERLSDTCKIIDPPDCTIPKYQKCRSSGDDRGLTWNSDPGSPLVDKKTNTVIGIFEKEIPSSGKLTAYFYKIGPHLEFINKFLEGRYERKVSKIQRENPDLPKYIVWIKVRLYDGITLDHVCSAAIINRYFIITAAKFVFGLNTEELLVRTNPWVVSSSRPFYDQVAIMKFHHPIAVLKVTYGFDDSQNELVQLPDYHTNERLSDTCKIIDPPDCNIPEYEKCQSCEDNWLPTWNIDPGSPLVNKKTNTIIGIFEKEMPSSGKLIELFYRIAPHLDFINKFLQSYYEADRRFQKSIRNHVEIVNNPKFHHSEKILDEKKCDANYPKYIVSIEKKLNTRGKYQHICDGTIIDKFYVITAAHCINERSKLSVRTRRMHKNLCSNDGINYNVVKSLRHPKYRKFSSKTRLNDIAILKIAGGFDLNSNFIAKVNFLQQNEKLDIGSALYDTRFYVDKDYYNVVMTSKKPVKDCKINMSNSKVQNYLCTESEIVAKKWIGYDGAPLVDLYDNLIGIRINKIYDNTSPSLYTKVEYFMEFIDEVLKQN